MVDTYSPMSGKPNEARGISSRIVDIKQLVVTMTPFLMRVIAEFNSKLIPKPHMMHPADYDEVYQRQSRPTQRRILITGETTNPVKLVQSFVKKETYESPNDPRIITTINANDKLEYSTFTYPMAELYAQQPWYAFSKTPLTIAQHAARACQLTEKKMALGDFARMDGHCNEIDRAINKATMTRAYHPKHHEKMLERMESQYDVRGYGAYGTKYDSAEQRLSGSPETAIFNSDITARTVFTGYRMTTNPITGTFYTSDEAWKRLCTLAMVGGDDSYAGDLEPEVFIKAAALYGQLLEVETVDRAYPGFNFLSRFYTDKVWYGNPASTCDVQRQVRKFHVTVHLPQNVTPVMKLVEKARAFYQSDAQTPIIGQLATYVVKLAKHIDLIERDDLRIFKLSTDVNEQYPNDISEDDACDELNRSKIDQSAVVILNNYLSTFPTLEQITQNMPLLVEPSISTPKLKDTVDIHDGNFSETLTKPAQVTTANNIETPADILSTTSTCSTTPQREDTNQVHVDQSPAKQPHLKVNATPTRKLGNSTTPTIGGYSTRNERSTRKPVEGPAPRASAKPKPSTRRTGGPERRSAKPSLTERSPKDAKTIAIAKKDIESKRPIANQPSELYQQAMDAGGGW